MDVYETELFMKILRKYTLQQLILPFLISLGVFTFMFLVGNLVRLADLLLNKGVNIFDVAKLLLLLMPKLLSFTLPMSALTAVLLVYGGFAQSNEVIAMKACGINIFRVMIPTLLVGVLLSFVSLFINDHLISKTRHEYREQVKNMFLNKPLAYLEAGRFIKEFKGYVILIQEIDGENLKGITIYQSEGDKPIRTILADRGEILSSPEERMLSLKLYDGTIDEGNPDDPNVFYKLDFETFELPPLFTGNNQPQNGKVNKKEKDMSLDELMLKLPNVKEEKGRLKIESELYKKISISMAPIIFILLGLPLAIITRRGEPIISFSIALGLICIYYVFFVWTDTLAIGGVVPPAIALWLPNIVLGSIGSFLIFKVVRS